MNECMSCHIQSVWYCVLSLLFLLLACCSAPILRLPIAGPPLICSNPMNEPHRNQITPRQPKKNTVDIATGHQTPIVKSCSMPGVTLAINWTRC